MKKIIAVVAIAFAFGLTVSSANAATFSTNLTVGSTGNDVVALQTWLVEKGFLTMPAGVAKGYFGQLTKSAVAAYQATVGLPTTGFFGPMTREKVGSVTVATGCPAGMVCTPTTPVVVTCPAGFTCTPVSGSTSTTVSTTGVEGTIVVEKETSGVRTTVYEGDTQVSVLGIRVEAKDSDAKVGRIKIGLGTTTDSYVKVFRKLYVTDANGTVLASKDLNSSTVSRDSSTSPAQYYVQLTDINYVVPAGTKKSLYVKADVSTSISSEYRRSWTISLFGSNDAVRSTDGAGIDSFVGGSSYGTNGAVTAGTYQAVTVSSSLSDNATLTVSTDADLRKASTIVADQGASNNERDMEVLGSFRLLAEKDDVLIRDVTVTAATTTAGDANLQTAYLFDGSTQIGSASVSVDSTGKYVAAFTSIDYRVPKDSTRVMTVKYDIRSAGTSAEVVALYSVAVGSAESIGTGRTLTVTTLSSGVGEAMTIVSKGAVTSLASTPTTAITVARDTNGSTTEAHLTATFNVKIKSVGSDVAFGTPGTAFQFTLIKNGVAYTALRSGTSATTTYYPSTQPTGVTGYSASGFTVPRNTEVTIPVTYKLDTTTGTSIDLPAGNYAVRLSTIVFGVAPATTGITADYSSNAAWVTSETPRP